LQVHWRFWIKSVWIVFIRWDPNFRIVVNRLKVYLKWCLRSKLNPSNFLSLNKPSWLACMNWRHNSHWFICTTLRVLKILDIICCQVFNKITFCLFKNRSCLCN
jgi:hypothetical protein